TEARGPPPGARSVFGESASTGQVGQTPDFKWGSFWETKGLAAIFALDGCAEQDHLGLAGTSCLLIPKFALECCRECSRTWESAHYRLSHDLSFAAAYGPLTAPSQG